MNNFEIESDSDSQESSSTQEQQQGPPDDGGYDENNGCAGNSYVDEDSDRSDQDCASDTSDHGEEGVDAESFFKKWAGMAFYVGRQLHESENRIRDLRPPASLCHRPRPISERKYWKATE
ncbi:hypothetical protein HPB52_002798 [Rhipicephalus sanguineus]|uniref:Uncharacterized protein n=1 Tax=Rhipicephalus sanguineus TaxID=34632 RepID=A0A9D4SXD1_RHISA|nr:hypothetical protein HPB52_002798 [Rhipicephalus sanguineus]